MKLTLFFKGVAHDVLYDERDHDLVSRHRWKIEKRSGAKTSFYASTKSVSLGKSKVYMHRMILSLTDPKIEVDHRFGNGLDNRRKMIRACTSSQNKMNRGKKVGTTSNFIGVCWYKQTRKWKSRVKIDGKEIHLGYFTSEIEAAKARDSKAKELHGEFANLNFK